MIIFVQVGTYGMGGGNPSISLVGEYFQMDQPYLGDAFKEIEVSIQFRRNNLPRSVSNEDQARYYAYLDSLPNWKLLRKKQKIQLTYLSRLGGHEVIKGYGPPRQDLFLRAARELAEQLLGLKDKLKKNDGFDYGLFSMTLQEKLLRLPSSSAEFSQLQTAIEADRARRFAAMSDWDRLAIDWADYHERAREILDDPYYWDCSDDFSPNGNDTGADLLELYSEWRADHKSQSAQGFLYRLMKEWEVAVSPRADDSFSTTTHEESVIGLAFAQIKVEAFCENWVRDQALAAIAEGRKRLQEGYSDATRMRTFDMMEQKLKEVPTKAL